MDKLLSFLKKLIERSFYGRVIFTFEHGRVVYIEKQEKFKLDYPNDGGVKNGNGKEIGKDRVIDGDVGDGGARPGSLQNVY